MAGYDMFQSRRDYNEKCYWWSRDKDEEEDALIMKRVPSGTFWAKEINPENNRDNVIAGVFMVDQTRVTIKTPDNLIGIKTKDIVLYQDEKWIITNIQKTKSKMQNTFFATDSNCSHFWFLELRK